MATSDRPPVDAGAAALATRPTLPLARAGARPLLHRRLLVHERVFGAYLAAMAASLLLRGGLDAPGALVYLALLAAGAAATSWSFAADTPGRWRVRLAFYPVAMNVAYLQMKSSVPFLQSLRADDLLARADALLLGASPGLLLEPLVNPVLTELLSACYLLYFPYLLASMVLALLGDPVLARRFYAGLFTIYGAGFIGYVLLPAAGPGHALADAFHVPLEGWAVTRGNAALVASGSNLVDVFPSLHVAVTAFILAFDRRHARRRFLLLAAPVAGLWVATIYLRYHYAVDVLAGFALAHAALRLADVRGDE